MSRQLVKHGDGVEPVAFTAKRRKARKRWRCVECLEAIEPGDHYRELSGVWPAPLGPQRFRMCSNCRLWADAAFGRLRLDGYPIGRLSEAIAAITLQADGLHYVVRRLRL